MKRPTTLLLALLGELAFQLSLSACRDERYLLSRLKHEGLSFLTITLPSFCDGFEEAIERGYATPDLFPAFARQKNGCLPKFLSGFTSLVFLKDGKLMDEPNPDAIFAIRQVTRFLKKVEIPCSNEREMAAIQRFKSIEGELAHEEESHFNRHDPILDLLASIITHNLFGCFDGSKLVCRHGPGVTADRLRSNERNRIRTWYTRSEPYFSSDLHAVPNYGFYEELSALKFLEPSEELPVKVVFVPKTLKTPRVIAVEPSHVQYMQQGLMEHFVSKIESHPLTRMSIRFRDQSVNNDAARIASIDKRKSTIDLSDASDRVSWSLVKRIFRGLPVLDYIDACRSRHAVLPDKTSLELKKFASMGSAMCFPMEALVFYILIQSGVHKKLGIRPSARSIENISRNIDIYGDDIIIPCGWLECVVTELEAFTLRVNRRKSFSKSHFRESCGGDFYNGVDVKPAYLRRVIPDGNKRWHPSVVMHMVSLANQFYLKGLWSTCTLIRGWVEHELRTQLPIRSYESNGLSWTSVRVNSYTRYHKGLCRYESRTIQYSPIRIDDDIRDDVVATWFKAFRNIGNDIPLELSTSVKTRAFRQKRVWAH